MADSLDNATPDIPVLCGLNGMGGQGHGFGSIDCSSVRVVVHVTSY